MDQKDIAWQPSCSLEMLHLRAGMLQEIRQFFADRKVLEVETPLLGAAIGTDPNLDFFTTVCQHSPKPQTFYLQTSPEFAMKRLLAAGSGSIYQICKAFRNGEAGRYHNPEFTLLEWYRVSYDLTQLMTEVTELMTLLFKDKAELTERRVSYPALFQEQTGLNALVFNVIKYGEYAQENGFSEAVEVCGEDHALWLDFIFSHQIQPLLGQSQDVLWLVYNYPACLPSLAKVNENNHLVVNRVEVFLNGVELGNGYHELGDAAEQERRFDQEIAIRQAKGFPVVSKDKRLLAALSAGLPDCSGIAIGLDRVLMLLSDNSHIDRVLPFSINNA